VLSADAVTLRPMQPRADRSQPCRPARRTRIAAGTPRSLISPCALRAVMDGRLRRALGLRALEKQVDINRRRLAKGPAYPGPFVRRRRHRRVPFRDGEFDLV